MNLRDIKTKQKMQAIKTKDTKGNIQHFIKQQTIHNKNVDRKEEASVKSNAQVQATNKVSVAAKQIVIESKYRATKLIKQKHHEYKIKSTNKKSIVESNHDIQPQKISYISKAKKHVVNKVNASKMKKSTEQFVAKPIVQNTTHAIKKSFHIVKKSVSTLNTLFSFGTGLILLIVITLFIGTFSVLAQDGGSTSEIVSLSEEVIAYEDTIRKYAIEYDIEDYVSLLQAIMMQESSGLIKYGGSIVPFVNKMPKGLLYDLNTTKPSDKKIGPSNNKRGCLVIKVILSLLPANTSFPQSLPCTHP